MKTINIKKLCMGCMKEKPSANFVCPYCGFDVAFYNTPEALPLGCKLQNKYIIGKEIGHGGFGKTYIAYDELLGVLCVKELFPERAYRDKNSCDIIPRVGFESEFDKLRDNAYEEALRLASFRDLHGIVKVYDCFEENNTSYIIMEYVGGINLGEYLEKMGNMSAETVLAKLQPVMKSLSEMHREGLIHRDIAPDNLMLKDDGTLVLIDFGSARNFTANMPRSLTKTLKSGYAPIEQYSGSNQGSWTDIYELCATIYTLVTGDILPDSTERISDDNLNLSKVMEAPLQQILRKGLALNYKDRYQTIDELYNALYETLGEKNVCANKISKTKKILATAVCLALFVCVVAFPQLRNRNLSESQSEKQVETNIVENRTKQSTAKKDIKQEPKTVEITEKILGTSEPVKQKEVIANEKAQNTKNSGTHKAETESTQTKTPDKSVTKEEEFYKRPVHAATEKDPYTLAEMRWIFKTEAMLKYMYPKLKTDKAHRNYQTLQNDVYVCYNDEGTFWADGDDYSIIQKAQTDVDSRHEQIYKEADRLLKNWNETK